jgi:dihydroxy-acid dehydratase
VVAVSLAILKDGDTIEINIPKRTLRVELEQEELKKRLKSWKPKPPKIKRGYLAKYSSLL